MSATPLPWRHSPRRRRRPPKQRPGPRRISHCRNRAGGRGRQDREPRKRRTRCACSISRGTQGRHLSPFVGILLPAYWHTLLGEDGTLCYGRPVRPVGRLAQLCPRGQKNPEMPSISGRTLPFPDPNKLEGGFKHFLCTCSIASLYFLLCG